MKTVLHHLAIAFAFTCGLWSAAAQGTAFTYQGALNQNGTPYTGSAEMQITLWDTSTGGASVATNSPASVIVGVTNGLFIMPLEFGNGVFNGEDRFVQIEVRTAIGPFTTLTPRQRVTATPYAVLAGNVSGSLPSANLVGTYSNAVVFNNATNVFSGNGAGLTDLDASQLSGGTVPALVLSNAWKTTGNAGTNPTNHFLGTTDNQPLELRVNNGRVFRLEPDTTGFGAPNVIGGAANNVVDAGIYGATVAGGGATNYGGPSPNRVSAIFGTIGGGRGNTVAADHSFIGGGYINTIGALSYDSVIAGGVGNTIQSNAWPGIIGGGIGNSIRTGAGGATIAGGNANTVQTNAALSTIGGGQQNTIGSNASYATIPGGFGNTAAADFSFAAGRNALAGHDGTFVWADANGTAFSSSAPNQFLIRASGGVGIGTVAPAAPFHLNGTGQTMAMVTSSHLGGTWLGIGNGSVGGQRWSIISSGSGNSEGAGRLLFFTSQSNDTKFRLEPTGSLFIDGTLTQNSDRNRKNILAPVDTREALEKVAALPLARWTYRDDPDAPHLGPMAQDFHAAFGLGATSTGIAAVDADGVALAAIQGLNQKLDRTVREKDAEIRALKKSLSDLQEAVFALAQRQIREGQ